MRFRMVCGVYCFPPVFVCYFYFVVVERRLEEICMGWNGNESDGLRLGQTGLNKGWDFSFASLIRTSLAWRGSCETSHISTCSVEEDLIDVHIWCFSRMGLLVVGR